MKLNGTTMIIFDGIKKSFKILCRNKAVYIDLNVNIVHQLLSSTSLIP